MSHASIKRNWTRILPDVEYIVGASQGSEGIYGARAVGQERGTCVLIVGHSIGVADFLDRLEGPFADRFEYRPRMSIL